MMTLSIWFANAFVKAYIDTTRLEEARRLLDVRRPGASGVPVTGVATVL